ncbi:MAG TPA: hypothetical protein VMV83_10230 [Rectinemataceae bacterium]|nr:hypothetical protein [Rectinemataceae bacterium]
MKIKITALSLALTGLALFQGSAEAANAVSADLIPAMVVVDKAYIPALALSGQPDQAAKAKEALAGFITAWKGFKDGPAAGPGFDEKWSRDLEEVDGAIASATDALKVEGDGAKAHEALEAVRITLLEARQRMKVPYFLDYVTLYHNSMEDILNGRPAKSIKDWSAAERLSFVSDLDIGIARWNKVKAMEGLLPEAGLSSKALAAYSSQWQVVASTMTEIRGALDAGDDKALGDLLGRLKPSFTKTFFLFGAFPQ